MKYRLLGKSGLRVSEAALGAMTFGDEWGWGSPKLRRRKSMRPTARQAETSLTRRILHQWHERVHAFPHGRSRG